MKKNFLPKKIDENPISILESIVNNTFNTNQYVSLYNYLFQINNINEFEEIMKSINQFTKKRIVNIQSNQNSKNLKSVLLDFYSSIKSIENLCQKMKNLLITPKTRVNSQILSLFNKYKSKRIYFIIKSIKY